MSGRLRRPIIPQDCQHNAHMYYILLPDEATRARLIQQLKAVDIMAVTHYVPLHNSPAGKHFGRSDGALPVTEDLSARILRLPLWIGVSEEIQDMIISTIKKTLQ